MERWMNYLDQTRYVEQMFAYVDLLRQFRTVSDCKSPDVLP